MKMLPLEYFLFLQIILFLFITPGTPRILIISYSMNYGVKSCVWTALGDITANLIQGTLEEYESIDYWRWRLCREISSPILG